MQLVVFCLLANMCNYLGVMFPIKDFGVIYFLRTCLFGDTKRGWYCCLLSGYKNSLS